MIFLILFLVGCGPNSNEEGLNSGQPETTLPSVPNEENQAEDFMQEQTNLKQTDWPMFRLNLAHTAAIGNQEITNEPQLLWKYDTGDVVESSPAIVDGVLFAGTFNQALLALDAATGKEIWRFPVGGLLRASPAVVIHVDKGVFFFIASNKRQPGVLWRFRPQYLCPRCH